LWVLEEGVGRTKTEERKKAKVKKGVYPFATTLVRSVEPKGPQQGNKHKDLRDGRTGGRENKGDENLGKMREGDQSQEGGN